MDEAKSCDRAELKRIETIPDGDTEGDYIREVRIEATVKGIEIDEYIMIPWEWIHRASEILDSSSRSGTARPSD